MLEVPVSEFRSNLNKYLGKAQKGESILLTTRGKSIAQISPPANIQKQAKIKLKALRKKCKLGDVLSPLDEAWEALK